MGEKGKLTQIDFSKNYVVVVTKPENEFATVLKPIDVVQIHNEIIQVNYSVEIGAKQSYSSVSVLLLILGKSATGKIVLNEMK